MQHQDIIELCDSVLCQKAREYATPEQRWHNFFLSSKLSRDLGIDLTPVQCAKGFALKHYTSCMDIYENRIKATAALVQEKGCDLVNYYLIVRCLEEDQINPLTELWLNELRDKNIQDCPWALGYKLLRFYVP